MITPDIDTQLLCNLVYNILIIICVCISWYISWVVSDAPYEPKAIFEWLDGKAGNGQAQMGYGIQRLPGLRWWLYELAGMSFKTVGRTFVLGHSVNTVGSMSVPVLLPMADPISGTIPSSCRLGLRTGCKSVCRSCTIKCCELLITEKSDATHLRIHNILLILVLNWCSLNYLIKMCIPSCLCVHTYIHTFGTFVQCKGCILLWTYSVWALMKISPQDIKYSC